ncbi:hypothetical protein SAMN04487788_0772 [Microbacterium testaceum StLB037]|uniref:Uncharacterized protein n=1 Tax=Microbacterium testaceum (strain StLB037) TaxID=979556 RepID=A0A1H0M808_MICTS|nr:MULTISPECIES: hypothetical protein [Microbacterium]MCY1715859.1 hypothetical protein [Microbacterium sp. SL62]SDO76356.1 hypothetical protein SAMN04487788_0772 [Microbacterium testaceum StLB037]
MTSEWAWSILVVIGAALWFWSIRLTLRAYAGERLPMWANPRKAPGRAVAARAFGIGAAILGVGMTSRAIDSEPWIAAVVSATVIAAVFFVPLIVSVAAHNARVDITRTT